MKKIIFICTAVALLVGCNPNKPEPPIPSKEYVVIGFEDAELLTHTGGLSLYFDNILWGKPQAQPDEDFGLWFDDFLYTEDVIGVGEFFCDWDGSYDYWSGFAISSNFSITPVGSGYQAQFHAATPVATKFAVAYDGGMTGGMAFFEVPTLMVSGTKTFTSAEFTNTTIGYNYALTANNSELWYNVTATGYLNDVETGHVVIELVKNGVAVSNWTEVSLLPLGEVDTITFKADSNDKTGAWLNFPAYFCMDNLKYEKAN